MYIETQEVNSDKAFKYLNSLIVAAGMKPPTERETDKIVRFSSDGNDKKNGWYILITNSDGSVGGNFGDWKTGYEKGFFIAPDGQKISEEMKKLNEEKLERMKKEIEKKQQDACTKAVELWDNACAVDPVHPYLMKKRISHTGLKQIGPNLVVPLYMDFADCADLPGSLQFIDKSGEKRFLSGGKVQGGFHTIGGTDNSDMIYVVEGYATGVTIHEATGNPVIVAFNAGNMKVVCQKIKDTFNDKRIIVAADNDIKTQEDGGVNRGKEVADEIFNELQIPYALCPVHSDFNDLFNAYGNQEEGYREVVKSLKKINNSSIYTELLDELNSIYAVTWVGNRCMVLKEEINPETGIVNDLQFTTDNDLRKFYANRTVPNPDDPDKDIGIIDFWWKSASRRQYNKICFEPGKDTPGDYNLWTDFVIKPVKGDWSLFKNHILNVIAGGNTDHFLWIMGWMARIFQDPGGDKPGTSIVLRGERGTGKSMFVEIIGSIFGDHYLHLAQQEHLLGKFNHHLKNKVLVFADEGFWAGDKQSEGSIKHMITEKNHIIEQKGKDAITVKNHINLIIASNNSWVVPAGLDERRFFVTDVINPHKQQDKYFSPIFKQMANDGVKAMLYDLLNWEYSLSELRRAPKTKALLDQIQSTMGDAKKFWMERLEEGTLSVDHVEWREEIGCGALYEEYLMFAKNLNQRFPLPKHQFGKEINQLCKGIITARPNQGGVRKRVYRCPPLEECRRQFEEIVSMPGQIDWEEGPS